MAQFPGLTIWTDAWVADTKHLSRLERGTYHDLLVLMWRTPGCRVPNDDAWLAKHLNMSHAEVAAELRPLIAEFCQADGNWLSQKRLKMEFVRRFEVSRAQSVRAKHPRKKNKTLSPGLAETHNPAKPPTLPLKKEINLSFNGESQREEPEAVSEKKRPEELTLAEINRLRYGKPNP